MLLFFANKCATDVDAAPVGVPRGEVTRVNLANSNAECQ